MKRKRLWLAMAWAIITVLMVGCRDHSPGNPVETKVVLDQAEGQLSDDISGSEIESPQYPEGTSVIVAIGDSITWGTGSSRRGYPGILRERLLTEGFNVELLNKAVPGERTSATHARFLEAIAGADIALIMIGINDIIDPRSCAEPYNCHTLAYIESLIDYALISKTIPVVSTVTPAKYGSSYEWANTYIKALNNNLYRAVEERNAGGVRVYLIDSFNAILANGGNTLYSDRLHFNDWGYAVLANEWYNALIGNTLLTKP